jgi:WASH complex subunit 7
MIVPPLTINYIEYMLASKVYLWGRGAEAWQDRLIKSKRGTEGCFVDDGFAIGIAYIVKVLDQNKSFDSLHWFESVAMKLSQEKDKLDKQRAEKKRASDEEVQTMQLMVTKLVTRKVRSSTSARPHSSDGVRPALLLPQLRQNILPRLIFARSCDN